MIPREHRRDSSWRDLCALLRPGTADADAERASRNGTDPSPVKILLLRNQGPRTRALSPSAVLVGSTVVGVLLFVLIGWNIAAMGRAYQVLESEAMRVQRLLDRMNYLGAKLTMAASMAAATGDTQWEQVYAPLEVEVRSVFDSVAS